MGKFSDILLTVDFDRTLTAPDSTIPPRNLEAIRWFMEEGARLPSIPGAPWPCTCRFRLHSRRGHDFRL